jgi:hypothetical protein
MSTYAWLEALSPVRRAAVFELAITARLTPDIIAAVRDEHFKHAAGLVMAAAVDHRNDAARIAMAITTGERQS